MKNSTFIIVSLLGIGLGAHYRYYPFRKLNNALAGILVLPSVRYWPNVWSSLNDNSRTSAKRQTALKPTKQPRRAFRVPMVCWPT